LVGGVTTIVVVLIVVTFTVVIMLILFTEVFQRHTIEFIIMTFVSLGVVALSTTPILINQTKIYENGILSAIFLPRGHDLKCVYGNYLFGKRKFVKYDEIVRIYNIVAKGKYPNSGLILVLPKGKKKHHRTFLILFKSIKCDELEKVKSIIKKQMGTAWCEKMSPDKIYPDEYRWDNIRR